MTEKQRNKIISKIYSLEKLSKFSANNLKELTNNFDCREVVKIISRIRSTYDQDLEDILMDGEYPEDPFLSANDKTVEVQEKAFKMVLNACDRCYSLIYGDERILPDYLGDIEIHLKAGFVIDMDFLSDLNEDNADNVEPQDSNHFNREGLGSWEEPVNQCNVCEKLKAGMEQSSSSLQENGAQTEIPSHGAKLTTAQVIHLVRYAKLDINNSTAQEWAAALHLISGCSINTLRQQFRNPQLTDGNKEQVELLYKCELDKLKGK